MGRPPLRLGRPKGRPRAPFQPSHENRYPFTNWSTFAPPKWSKFTPPLTLRCDAAEVWGHARTSSSDGQRYLFPRKTLKATYSHRLGDYVLEFYTFVADNYAPFYSTPDRVHGTGRSLRSGWAPLPRVRGRS